MLAKKKGKYLPMSALPLPYQNATRHAVMSLAAFLQKQKLSVHIAHRFLGLQHYYITIVTIAVRIENFVF